METTGDQGASGSGTSRPIRDRVWAVIPVYNNRDTIREVARNCRRMLPHVVVVDDGSTDADMAALLAGLDVDVVRHARNRGKGAAIRTALRHVAAQGGDFLITIDADGQHDPADIAKFLPVLESNPAAIIIGARRMEGPHVPASSRFGRVFSDFWLRLETGIMMRDTQSGFRAYPVRYLSQLEFVSSRYDFEIEILARAAWAGLAVKSVDVSVTYAPRDKRVSHFRPFLDNLRITHRHILLLGRRLWPWPHRRLLPAEEAPWRVFLRSPVAFFRKLLVEHASPGELAVAAGVGVLLATLPLISLHTVAILYVTTRLNLNRLMAVAVQNLCMPPFVPFVCVELGYFLRHGRWLRELTWEAWGHQAPQRLWEWFLGSLLAAPLLAVITGLLVYGIAVWLEPRRGSAS